MSTEQIYDRLAKHLDNLPAGYPSTESGVEMRILRRLFTPEEAALAIHLSLLPERARVIAKRAGLPVEEVARMLAEMERKGLLYSYVKEGKEPRYMATHFVVGIYEFQVNKMDRELVEDLEEYLPEIIPPEQWQKAPQLRTIPIEESINPQLEVMPYEQAALLMGSQSRFAVAPCICRQSATILETACDKPVETCLMSDENADFYLRNGMAREITKDDALRLLVQAEDAGLVLQPGNHKESQFICMCCGCCCGVLTNIKKHPEPASVVSTPFRAVVDADICDECGTCLDRCQMEAISLDDGPAEILNARCIGCGLCVTTCPNEALSLVRKPETEQPYVPKNITEAMIRVGQARGKLGLGEMAGIKAKSVIDRLTT